MKGIANLRPSQASIWGECQHSCAQDQRLVVRPCLLAKTLFGCLAIRIYAVSHEGTEGEVHGLPFSQELQAVILPQNEGMGHNSRTDEYFRPAQGGRAKYPAHLFRDLHGHVRSFLSTMPRSPVM